MKDKKNPGKLREALSEALLEIIITLIFFGIGALVLGAFGHNAERLDFDTIILIGIGAIALITALVFLIFKLVRGKKETSSILCFGEIIADEYPDSVKIGGAPFNFAAHAVKSGAKVHLLSAVGNDTVGEKALAELDRYGIEKDYVKVLTGVETGRCTLTLENGEPKYEIAKKSAYDEISAAGLRNKNFEALVFGTLALRGESNRKTLEALLKENRFKTVFCDLNLRYPFYEEGTVLFAIEKANILKLNEYEYSYVKETLLQNSNLSEEETAKELCRHYENLTAVLITKGKDGAYAYSKEDERFIFVPAKKIEEISAVGAGDSFAACFLVSYLRGYDLSLCLQYAAARGAYVAASREAIPEL